MRKEHDFLGELEVPDDVYYGVQTMRAVENFYITGQRPCADRFVRHVLDRKGLFVPPHLTRTKAEDLLRSLYGDNVTVRNERSILIFKARKP